MRGVTRARVRSKHVRRAHTWHHIRLTLALLMDLTAIGGICLAEEGMGSFRVEAFAIHNQADGIDEYHYTLTNINYCGGISYFSIDMGGGEASELRSSLDWPTARADNSERG